MASSIGPALRRHATVRPVLLRVIRPASDSTSRCFITAGKDIANGAASSLTDRSCCDRRASNARRVGSESAAKVRSSNASLNLTMRLSIETNNWKSRTGPYFRKVRGHVRRKYQGNAKEIGGAEKDTRYTAEKALQRTASRWRTTDYSRSEALNLIPPHSRVPAKFRQIRGRAPAILKLLGLFGLLRPLRSPSHRDRNRPAR
jgi:hypothetical protein